MARSVLKELEDLRRLLDSPSRYAPSHSAPPTQDIYDPQAPSPQAVRTYGNALHNAEKSVTRLGRAIEVAEEEMEQALRRTTDVHLSQLKQREMELQARLQHLLF